MTTNPVDKISFDPSSFTFNIEVNNVDNKEINLARHIFRLISDNYPDYSTKFPKNIFVSIKEKDKVFKINWIETNFEDEQSIQDIGKKIKIARTPDTNEKRELERKEAASLSWTCSCRLKNNTLFFTVSNEDDWTKHAKEIIESIKKIRPEPAQLFSLSVLEVPLLNFYNSNGVLLLNNVDFPSNFTEDELSHNIEKRKEEVQEDAELHSQTEFTSLNKKQKKSALPEVRFHEESNEIPKRVRFNDESSEILIPKEEAVAFVSKPTSIKTDKGVDDTYDIKKFLSNVEFNWKDKKFKGIEEAIKFKFPNLLDIELDSLKNMLSSIAEQNPEFRKMLMETEDEQLIARYSKSYPDQDLALYLGIGQKVAGGNTGRNLLGMALTEVRNELR